MKNAKLFHCKATDISVNATHATELQKIAACATVMMMQKHAIIIAIATFY